MCHLQGSLCRNQVLIIQRATCAWVLWLEILRRLAVKLVAWLITIKYPIRHKCPASVQFTHRQASEIVKFGRRAVFARAADVSIKLAFSHSSGKFGSERKKQKNNRNKQTKAQAQTCSLAKLETGRKSCRAAKLRVQVFRLAGATPALSSSEEKQQQLWTALCGARQAAAASKPLSWTR